MRTIMPNNLLKPSSIMVMTFILFSSFINQAWGAPSCSDPNITLCSPYTDINNCSTQCSITAPQAAGSGRGGPSINTSNGTFTYNQYDLTCPDGYSVLSKRFLSGGFIRWPSTFEQMLALEKQGATCGPDYSWGTMMVPASPGRWLWDWINNRGTYTRAGVIQAGSALEYTADGLGQYVYYVTSMYLFATCYHFGCECQGDTSCFLPGTTTPGSLIRYGACQDDDIKYSSGRNCLADPNTGPYFVWIVYMGCTLPQKPLYDPNTNPVSPEVTLCGYTNSYHSPGAVTPNITRTTSTPPPVTDSTQVAPPPSLRPMELKSGSTGAPSY